MSEHANDDFKFFIDEVVQVGTMQATVCGTAFFKNMPDAYQLQYQDENGCLVESWFAEHLISKTGKH